MTKNKQNKYQNYAYSIKKYFDKSSNSLCLVTKDNIESKYIFNELSILIENKPIQLFPENDILPYDHFSIPEEITASPIVAEKTLLLYLNECMYK